MQYNIFIASDRLVRVALCEARGTRFVLAKSAMQRCCFFMPIVIAIKREIPFFRTDYRSPGRKNALSIELKDTRTTFRKFSVASVRNWPDLAVSIFLENAFSYRVCPLREAIPPLSPDRSTSLDAVSQMVITLTCSRFSITGSTWNRCTRRESRSYINNRQTIGKYDSRCFLRGEAKNVTFPSEIRPVVAEIRSRFPPYLIPAVIAL